jgi:hypothetical protein
VIAEGSKSDVLNIKDEQTYRQILGIAQEHRKHVEENGEVLSL